MQKLTMVVEIECGKLSSNLSQEEVMLDGKFRPVVTREDSEAFSEATTPWYESDDEEEEENDLNSLDIDTIRQRLLNDSSETLSPCASWRNSKVNFSDTDNVHVYEPPALECYNDLYYHSEEMQEFLDAFLEEQQNLTQRFDEGSSSVKKTSKSSNNIDTCSLSQQRSSVAK